MTLFGAFKALLDIGARAPTEARWTQAKKDFSKAVDDCSDLDELLRVLAEDSGLEIPIDLRIRLYRRSLDIGGRSPALLREFAWYLELHGPDWDEEAARLREDADRQDHESGP